ncbi:DUF805 domain-containing protein [Novosphingobium sp. YAF33]|uniref:DUF805 domain-containing protein n=1 Tax=Novosphingobium sp. YAF33 TaxID=3233082 RepID=UPI003F99CA8A
MKEHPLHAIGRTLRLSLTPTGRSRRSEVWIYLLSAALIAALLSGLVSWIMEGPLASWIGLALVLVCALPAPAVAVRRFHDIGLSGWWTLPLMIGALRLLLLEILQRSLGWNARAMAESIFHRVDWAILPAFGLAYLALLTWPGTRGDNRFGPRVT